MLSDVGLRKSFAWWLCEQDLVTFFFIQFQSFQRMFIMSQELCVNQRNEPSHIIVGILLNHILVSFLFSQWFTCKAYDTHKYVWIQCFKLLFKLDEQTTQWII